MATGCAAGVRPPPVRPAGVAVAPESLTIAIFAIGVDRAYMDRVRWRIIPGLF